MVCRSYILISLISSSCSLEYGVKKFLKVSTGNRGISGSWTTECPGTWSIYSNGRATCFPKEQEKANCTLLSPLYDISEAKELYVNIQTNTRNCPKTNFSDCTGKFSVLVNYKTNNNDFKCIFLADEIPRKNPGLSIFYDAEDTIHFSVEQNYKSLKLGFQAPFYCGIINSVSLYYYFCPTKTNALVDFPEIQAPSKALSPSMLVGTCTKNAVKKSSDHNLYMKCYYNGTAEMCGGCECETGYTKKENMCEGQCF